MTEEQGPKENEEQQSGQDAGQPEQPAQEPAAEPAPPAPEAQAAGEVGEAEINEGKAFAILSYALSLVGLPFFIVPLIMRNNGFALFHAKQCLMIWLAGIVGGVISSVLAVICIGIIIGLVVGIFLLVLTIMGIVNAAKGEMRLLPLIGKWGEEWFKGLQKV